MKRLHRSILDYGELKRQWGYGHIEIRYEKCVEINCLMWPWEEHILLHNTVDYHPVYLAHYVNKHDMKRKISLGSNMHDSFINVKSKKRYLLNTSHSRLAIKTD